MPEKPRSLTARTVSGAAWSAIGSIGQQLITLVGTVILARVLAPADYGLVGMATVVIAFVLVFRDLGTSAAVIQRPVLTDEFVSTLFWVNLLFGLGACFTGVLLAPAIAAFYQTSAVAPVMRALSLSLFAASFGIVPAALLSRQLGFRKIALCETASAATATTVAVAMALRNHGVWSLVAANLVRTVLESVLFFALCSWRPRFSFRPDEIRRVYSFSANLVGSQLVNYFARNADKLIIGRYLGSVSLGYYQLAYQLMLYPVQSVTGVLGRVLFPAFAQVQDDHQRFRPAYLQACVTIATLTFPMMLGLTVVAGPFVEVFFGPKWRPVGMLLTVLAPVGMVQSVASTVGGIYMAKGRTQLMFRVTAGATVVFVAAFALGLRWGVLGVATAYAIASIALTPFLLRIATSLIELPLSTLIRKLAPVLGFSLPMLLPVALLRLVLERGAYPKSLVLGSAVALGVMVHAACLLYWRPTFLRDMVTLASSALPTRAAGVVQRWVTG
jgi:O-antigen/teichoic acid export membrane protein